MVNTEDLRTAVAAHVDDNWSQTPIKYDNIEFNEPNKSPWVELKFLPGPSRAATTLYNEHLGAVNLVIHVPHGAGTRIVYTYADQLGALFNRQRLGNIRFKTPTTVPLGEIGEWFVVQVTIPFWVIG